MSESKVEIKVPEELIRSMVGAAVIAQVGDPVQMTAALLAEILTKATRDPKGGYGKERPLIEWFFIEEAHRLAKEEVQRFIAAHEKPIRAAIAKELKTTSWGVKLAEALVSALSRDAEGYGLRFAFEAKLKVEENRR